MPKKRMSGTKVLGFIKKAYAKGLNNREVAEQLTVKAKEKPEWFGFGDKPEWDQTKVYYYTTKNGIGRGRSQEKEPTQKTWTRKTKSPEQLEFQDVHVHTPASKEQYVLVFVPQSKLQTIMEVLK